MAPNRFSVRLVHGTQIRSSRRLYATRALGLHDQATRKAAQQRAPSATGHDLPRHRRGLRSRASRGQGPERSPPLARQLSAEGLHIRVGQQPEGCVVSPAQAGISEPQGILVAQKEQRSAIDPELFCGFGRRSSALPCSSKTSSSKLGRRNFRSLGGLTPALGVESAYILSLKREGFRGKC